MLVVLTNATLDITFSVGWWVVKKVAGGVYSLGSYLFEKHPFPLVEDKPSEADIKRMAKWFGTLEALEKETNSNNKSTEIINVDSSTNNHVDNHADNKTRIDR
jgi:hypothetical protein